MASAAGCTIVRRHDRVSLRVGDGRRAAQHCRNDGRVRSESRQGVQPRGHGPLPGSLLRSRRCRDHCACGECSHRIRLAVCADRRPSSRCRSRSSRMTNERQRQTHRERRGHCRRRHHGLVRGVLPATSAAARSRCSSAASSDSRRAARTSATCAGRAGISANCRSQTAPVLIWRRMPELIGEDVEYLQVGPHPRLLSRSPRDGRPAREICARRTPARAGSRTAERRCVAQSVPLFRPRGARGLLFAARRSRQSASRCAGVRARRKAHRRWDIREHAHRERGKERRGLSGDERGRTRLSRADPAHYRGRLGKPLVCAVRRGGRPHQPRADDVGH